MPILIDAHEDLAYNALTFGRDIRRPAAETRRLEVGSDIPEHNGQAVLGWEDFQRGQVAVVFGTLFAAPRRYGEHWDTQAFETDAEFRRLMLAQADFYNRLCGESPDKFRRIFTRRDLQAHLAAWEAAPANPPAVSHPVGLVTLMEGAEGISQPRELEEWWELGVRLIGLVWAGTRHAGGTMEHGPLTAQGRAIIAAMAEMGFILDISHMTDLSAHQALDVYEGTVIATHANARAILRNVQGERHLTDSAIHKLVERDGVMGIVPFNRFLKPDWTKADRRETVTLDLVIAQVDHVCQLAGSARHVAFGTDFDGGLGWPSIPLELNTIADLQKMDGMLAGRGYSKEDIALIFGGNWRRILERGLPE